MNNQHDLKLILRSHAPIIIIESHEEERALRLLHVAASDSRRTITKWTTTSGLEEGASPTLQLQDQHTESSTTEPPVALQRIKSQKKPGIFALLDFHHYLEEPRIIRLLKEIALGAPVMGHTLVLISHNINLPDEISRFSARFELSMPDENTLRQMLVDESKVWALKNQGNKINVDATAMELLVRNLLGLTHTDATRLIRNAIHDDGAITHADVPQVQTAKYQLIGQGGMLSFEYDTARLSDVGGLSNIKTWLEKRRASFLGETGLDRPKGILLVGIQGGGKSLAAKAVAGVWGVPLLRLDFGALYNKYHGETERNTREALKLAEVMAPCILWIDEIEKGIATGDQDNGTSKRVLSTLLVWMAETKARVFIVATANDIQALPPELIRKGRLDEIFFVDLPSEKTRAEIFAIHLRKRKLDPATFDTQHLAQCAEGFSGAEIEQAVVAARYTIDAQSQSLTTEHIARELQHTKPLSVVMDEQINALRAWAQDRTVAAD